MNSKQAKDILKSYTADHQKYYGAATEVASANNADILTLDHRKRCVEFEIKVSRQDLRNEAIGARIAWQLENPEDHYVWGEEKGWNGEMQRVRKPCKKFDKVPKHAGYYKHYIRHDHDYGYFVPHKFYFAVPHELVDYAKQMVKGLPYGVFDLSYPRIAKPAKILTQNGATDRVLIEMFARAINEYYRFSEVTP